MFTKFCIRALLIVSCVFGASNLNAGVSDETLVQTQDGPKSLRILKIGDKILCSNMQNLSVEERAISAIEEVEAPRVIEITTSDNVTFYVAEDQKLFVTHKWVEAQQLTLEDVLMTKDRTFVKVVGIRHLEKPMKLRFISVDEHHNFFAAENGVLIHNGPLAAHQAYWATKLSLYAALGITAGAVVVGGGALAVAGVQAIGTGVGGLVAVKGAADVVVGTTLVTTTATTVGAGGIAAEVTGSLVAGTLIASGTAAETAVIAGTVTSVTASTVSTALAADAAILAGEATAATGFAASTLAAVETAAMTAFAAALVCPWTPW